MSGIMTIGHSTHSFETFVNLLQRFEVTAVADVRSTPYSRYNPHYNRESLKAALKSAGIAYAFMGRELGARSDEPCHYDDGRVVYSRVADSVLFRQGIDRVIGGAKEHRIALMCAERDPITCHRTILVARALFEAGAEIEHILPDGTLESQDDAMERLMRGLGLDPNDLFASPEDLLERAYWEQEQRIAYTLPNEVAAE